LERGSGDDSRAGEKRRKRRDGETDDWDVDICRDFMDKTWKKIGGRTRVRTCSERLIHPEVYLAARN
jgi:hypothetical protein